VDRKNRAERACIEVGYEYRLMEEEWEARANEAPPDLRAEFRRMSAQWQQLAADTETIARIRQRIKTGRRVKCEVFLTRDADTLRAHRSGNTCMCSRVAICSRLQFPCIDRITNTKFVPSKVAA